MDTASARYLRKLCGEEPHKFGMDSLFRMIREFVVRTDLLQQRRIIGLLNFKQRPGELFSQALCRYDDVENDCDIGNYSVDEMRAHLRVTEDRPEGQRRPRQRGTAHKRGHLECDQKL